MPIFKGPEPGPHLTDYLDMNPNDPSVVGQVFAMFFTGGIFEKMRIATNSFGRLYVKRWTREISFEEIEAFIGLIIHLGLIKYEGNREKIWEKSWKGNEFVRTGAWHNVNYEQ